MNSATDGPRMPGRSGNDAPATPVPTHHRPVPGRRPDGTWSTGFLVAHWGPALLVAGGAVLLATFAGDQWLADRLYAAQGNAWPLRQAFVTGRLIHIGGRDLSTLAWLGVLAAWLVARTQAGVSAWRTPLAILLVSSLLAPALVAWIKSWSNVDCPWDLTRYGGAREFVGLLSPRRGGVPQVACFPAGHASAGYSWMALYFFFLATRPRWRWLGLSVGLLLGLVFGAAQQLRGAHFLSHDLWTAAICWSCALGGYLAFHRRSGATALAATGTAHDLDQVAPRHPPSALRDPAGNA